MLIFLVGILEFLLLNTANNTTTTNTGTEKHNPDIAALFFIVLYTLFVLCILDILLAFIVVAWLYEKDRHSGSRFDRTWWCSRAR
jgi:uncharacterized membrane protein YozB (DUF420 family)